MEDLNGKVVLIVEDEAPLANAVKLMLKNNEMNAVIASSADEAEGLLKKYQHVRAIWLDHYLLGGRDGLHFLASIKNDDSKYKDIPVFVVSNTATQDKGEAYLRLGAKKFYTKANY